MKIRRKEGTEAKRVSYLKEAQKEWKKKVEMKDREEARSGERRREVK